MMLRLTFLTARARRAPRPQSRSKPGRRKSSAPARTIAEAARRRQSTKKPTTACAASCWTKKTRHPQTWSKAFDAAIDLPAAAQPRRRNRRLSRERPSPPTRTIGGYSTAVAQSYLYVDHYGYMIAGEFQRGQHRGGGKVVHATARDRVRALQLFRDAMKVAEPADDKARARRHAPSSSPTRLLYGDGSSVAAAIAHRPRQAARLRRRLGLLAASRKARPSTPRATRSSTTFPKAWDAAKNDGERWRWLLETMVEWHPATAQRRTTSLVPDSCNRSSACKRWPSSAFCCPAIETDDAKNDDKTGIWALDTLGEDETIARLATGIKRFKLPDEQNFIKLFQQVAAIAPQADADRSNGLEASRSLAVRSSRTAGNIRGRPNTGEWRSSARAGELRKRFEQRSIRSSATGASSKA